MRLCLQVNQALTDFLHIMACAYLQQLRPNKVSGPLVFPCTDNQPILYTAIDAVHDKQTVHGCILSDHTSRHKYGNMHSLSQR
jgi:hypothetical protein